MARAQKPRPDQVPVLEELHRAAELRREGNRLYLWLFAEALRRKVRPSVIGRYVRLSDQAVNSTRIRLEDVGQDDEAPQTIDEVLKRVYRSQPPTEE
ncbi:hypothetical protein [Mycobacteroides abscessus]|uniref:hypothetical protein n=1 Tax=Mycobacteroides abscessus TaxID=36809 RepID=UPI000C257C93|nr:hypothetical protein [Mycobacteroides abscessus]